jgi:hypothetical protein
MHKASRHKISPRNTSRVAIICCAFGLAWPASAQLGQFPFLPFADGIGVKLGTTPTAPVSSSDWLPKSESVIAGFYSEFHLPRGLSLEVDFLHFSSLDRNTGGAGSVWQFPVLLKAGPHLGRVRPYVEGGPNLSYLSVVGNPKYSRFNSGVTFGAGLEIRARAGRIAPEFRFNEVGSINGQAVFLLGLGLGRE